jgi:Mn2+/Fe2+ NRAMP family transporter
VAGLALVIVLLRGMPLIGVLVLAQVLNAILLLPLLVFMYLLARDPQVMGGLQRPLGDLAPAIW